MSDILEKPMSDWYETTAGAVVAIMGLALIFGLAIAALAFGFSVGAGIGRELAVNLMARG